VTEVADSVRDGVRSDEGTRARRRLWLGPALLTSIIAAIAVLVAAHPFNGGHSPARGLSDNASATRLQRITEQALSGQTQVQGTLGYAGDSTLRVPAGDDPSVASHAHESVASDQRTLAFARASLANDEIPLQNAQSTVSAGQQRQAVGCAADNAAQGTSTTSTPASGSGSCLADTDALSSDQRAQTQAAGTVIAAQRQVSSDESSVALSRSELASSLDQETVYGQDSDYTALPAPAHVVRRGEQLYAIDGQPVLLLYGHAVAQRAFRAGMSSGPDVAELNANLDALGYGHGLGGDTFTTTTASAVVALQRARGMTPTATLLLGSVVFAPGAVRITGVGAGVAVGASVRPGPVLSASSTRRVVTIRLDASLEGQVERGDPVIITLPDNSTTPGHISSVSTVAETGQNGTTVTVRAVLNDPSATGNLDQAPVGVQVTTAHVRRALVVPVNALLALATGGYAVEEVRGRAHHLVSVHTGLFDDADGLVQIIGTGVAAGQHVVVPGS
jgi:hypothetical protein